MYNKLLIIISYHLDRFLLLNYPSPPIWGEGNFSPFLILPMTPLLQAHFGTEYLCIFPPLTDWEWTACQSSFDFPKHTMLEITEQ